MIRQRRDLADVRRMVVKIGSSLLADPEGGVRQAEVERFAAEIAALHKRGIEVAIVSSGAVALGCVHLGWVGRKLSVHEKQAAAAIGQPALMHAYSQAFAEHGLKVAQMLLTKDDLRHRRRYLNASNTSETLFDAGIVPIVNENDTVVVQEIKFGDNDNLAALVGLMIDAGLLAVLTDVEGLFTRNPAICADAERIGLVRSITPEIMEMAGDEGSDFGTGGMASKLRAASIATRGGVATAILSGHAHGVLAKLLAGEEIGTLFACGVDRQTRRQHWIAEVLTVSGRIRIDAGAARAIVSQGGSLLPVGVTAVEGGFDKGECVEIIDDAGRLVARGLCNYSAEEMQRLIGVASHEIEQVLGYSDFSSVVHRDNLALMKEA
ncbi:MAG TPA: glutamate 5-kinase [Mariprofundaceae bacterium]|nr:glutamate 5-kinase [Mariprofundaceae bacterium]